MFITFYLVHIPSQINPVHALPLFFFKFGFIITVPSTTSLSKCSLSLEFTHPNPVCVSLPSYIRI